MGAPKGNQYAVGNNGGRPTKYTPEIVEQALAYLEEFNTKHGHSIPSAIGMSKILKLDESTLYDWAKQEDNEFSKILPRCKKYQEFELIDGGLKGDLNSNIVKLALGKHGYSDKQDTNVNANVSYESLSEDEVERLLQERLQERARAEED